MMEVLNITLNKGTSFLKKFLRLTLQKVVEVWIIRFICVLKINCIVLIIN